MRWLLRSVIFGLILSVGLLQAAMVLGHANSGDEMGVIALERTNKGAWYYRLTLIDNSTNVTYPLVYKSGRQGNVAWSPDGTRVALTQTSDGTPDLVILDIATRDMHPLHTGLRPDAPAWSPDGTQIAFLADQTGGAADLFVYTFATQTITNLTSTRADETRFAWSPDSTQLAVVVRDQVWLVSAGGVSRQLNLALSEVPMLPQWSPNGRFLAVLDKRSGHPIVMDLTDDSIMDLSVCAAPVPESFTWSPDGRFTCPVYKDMAHVSGVRLVNVQTGDETIIALDDEAIYRLAWAADGHLLTYYRVQQRDRLIVAAYDVGAHRLTPVSEREASAVTSWRPG